MTGFSETDDDFWSEIRGCPKMNTVWGGVIIHLQLFQTFALLSHTPTELKILEEGLNFILTPKPSTRPQLRGDIPQKAVLLGTTLHQKHQKSTNSSKI